MRKKYGKQLDADIRLDVPYGDGHDLHVEPPLGRFGDVGTSPWGGLKPTLREDACDAQDLEGQLMGAESIDIQPYKAALGTSERSTDGPYTSSSNSSESDVAKQQDAGTSNTVDTPRRVRGGAPPPCRPGRSRR